MTTPITNRAGGQSPEGDWYLIEAKGRHPNRASGVVQVIDDAAIKSMADNFNADAKAGTLSHGNMVLVDRDHLKDQADQETRAYGWLMECQARSDGLWGRIKWTTTGKAAVDGGDYKFFSTEYNLNDCERAGSAKEVRPLRLDGLTLTNMPNNRQGQIPITNREAPRVAEPSPVINRERAAADQRLAAANDIRRATGCSFDEAWSRTRVHKTGNAGRDIFNVCLDLVRNRTGASFQQAFRAMHQTSPDLLTGEYETSETAQALGGLTTAIHNRCGATEMESLQHARDGVQKLVNRTAPQLGCSPTAFAWDCLNRAANALAVMGVPRQIMNGGSLPGISGSDAQAAKAKSAGVLAHLQATRDVHTSEDIGQILQAKNASASLIWGTFYTQVKKLMNETGCTSEEAFNQLKKEQPLFWTMAMLACTPPNTDESDTAEQ